MFLRAGRHEVIPDIFLCAGYETGGQDSCQVYAHEPYIKTLISSTTLSSREVFHCSFISRRVIPEVLSKYAEKMVGTFSPVSYRGGSDARKLTCRESVQGSPNSYRGFWRTLPDLLYDQRDYDGYANNKRELDKTYTRMLQAIRNIGSRDIEKPSWSL